ncbi:glycosyltransferase [Acidithiobacillus ferriphilus]|uniref:glycosyltransferase n=1 Tax=Acidithiobacillus ferriphilus TaxID=1689834 RepID=UPI001C06C5F6|nr:glycosyltransferase [Acidithiobacillus ferriphilus]MBU2848916.1 glycosyltransferase [Acidithiobacillus ferriphilus]
MRIVIDLQGAQNDSRNRGIGRYSLSIALAIAKNKGPHEILIMLSAAFADTIDEIRAAFGELLSDSAFKIFNPLGPTHTADPLNIWRRDASELLYEHFLAALNPDAVIVCSLMEGWGDQTISSVHKVKQNYLIAPVLYDLIPLVQHHQDDLDWPEATLAWYLRKVDDFRRTDFGLSISESSKSEAVSFLGCPAEKITNISAAVSDLFHEVVLETEEIAALKAQYAIVKRFVLTSSAIEERKNPEHLIRAFALLPKAVRNDIQLVFIGKFTHPDYKYSLLALAAQSGLDDNDVLFTGYVPDNDLVRLYAACDLFVFPSLHEGFGLPALEAMACGAPTIASDTTSLPEVMGWDEALFDPNEPQSIAHSMERVLTNERFRQQLIQHGLQQAKKFSWDRSARLALQAVEAAHAQWQTQNMGESVHGQPPRRQRPRLAYFSSLREARSGIADYSAELLPELSRYYAIEVIVDQEEPVTDSWVLGNATLRSVAWFEQHAHHYDRILYQFGNSEYHAHMFNLLERYPGVVVLHDFYLSGVLGWVLASQQPSVWDRALLHAHGWPAMVERYRAENQRDIAELIAKYPCNLRVLQQARGIIVHSDCSLRMAKQWYGAELAADWSVIPHLRVPVVDIPRAQARTELGFTDDIFLVCAFGLLGETKLNHTLIEAWASSALAKNPRCRLVFVGKLPDGGSYGDQLRRLLKSIQGHITITGWADGATYKRYLAAADLAVQLRTQSRGETSGTVLDCMNYGLPTIVNANGSMADLPSNVVYRLPEALNVDALSQALEQLYDQPALRSELGRRAAAHIRKNHLPRKCAAQYAQAIERFYDASEEGAQGLVKQLQSLPPPPHPGDLVALAEHVAQIYPPRRPTIQQLLLDISGLARHDGKSGIERVVRSVLQELLRNPPDGYRVEPIYATPEHGYRYARKFTARLLELGDFSLSDDPVCATMGDVFFSPDWVPDIVRIHEPALSMWRLQGIKMIFMVYDVLPLTLPETTHISVHEAHMRWLLTLAKISSGLICISATVMASLKEWLRLFGPQTGHSIPLGWTPLGSDVVDPTTSESFHATSEQSAQLAAIRRFPAFLMVGTVEPRKGHAQTLAAFDRLWAQGIECNLVIVGKQGWKVDELAERLLTHPQRERHLFWLQGIDDDLLEQVYAASRCLIAASLDEGFGLPLIEAARHKLPILARDIPVFREVAGEHASYFSGLAPEDLSRAIVRWLEQEHAGTAVKSDAMPWLTWAAATQEMLDVILNDQWQDLWTPVKDDDLVARHWGSDHRVMTVVGERIGTAIRSTGVPGYLTYGPARLSLRAGSYIATWTGHVGLGGCDDGAHMDVSYQQGAKMLARADLAGLAQNDGRFTVTLPFILDEGRHDLEVRVWVGERSDVSLDKLEIRKATSEPALKPPRAVATTTAIQATSFPARTYRYWATHPKMTTFAGYPVGRSVHATGTQGWLLSGPYVELPKGRYLATVRGASPAVGGLDDCRMDVAWNKGLDIAIAQPLYATKAASSCELGRAAFELTAYASDVEVRVYVGSGISLRIDGIVLEEVA